MSHPSPADAFIAQWRGTGGSELANTQSFINGLCALIGVEPPHGSRTDDAHNDYVFERRVFQDNGDGTTSFGRIDAYKRGCFILEAKQGSEGDRAAANRGEDDLDLFGQTATTRLKRGTAKRGTPAWAKAMVQAKGQAERYAKALPVDHGWPPFLLVADIGYCIEVYADFTGTGKAYAQFPDRSRYRIMLDDLSDEPVRERLAAIWTDPASLDPSAQAARVTREIADLLATVSRRLEARGHAPEEVSGFLSRVLFTMFAEDTGVLLPRDSFKTLLRGQLDHPEHLHHQLSALWRAMEKGEFAPGLGIPVKRFNGYLFKDTAALPLEKAELEALIEASLKDWTEVEPAIFGTLLERALSAKDRAKLGAHFTPRAYVERLVGPTIIEPLRVDWAGVRVAATELIDAGKPDEARRTVQAFHTQLAQTRVLDPACGTGNFLYVAMARMKELEGEVLDLLLDLGDDQYLAELTGHTVTPENFLGIEINPRAAAIAQLVLWIGYLQWHFRVNGPDRAPPEPILRNIRTIENRDALIAYDERVIGRDANGLPLTRWDGETIKEHPITGKSVPDETARTEVYRYVRPRAATWPKADFIIGNPPFMGGKDVREKLGAGYFDALFKTTDVPESADFVMHWWNTAALAVRKNGARRFGFVTANSITQVFSRRIIARHLDAKKDGLSLRFAIPNHPWIDERDGAAVRIAMTVATKGKSKGVLLTVNDESDAPDSIEFTQVSGQIGRDLRTGADITGAKPLLANAKLASRGVPLHGKGFLISANQVAALSQRSNDDLDNIVKPYRNGRDIAQRPRGLWVIDTYGLSENQLKEGYPRAYQHLLLTVKPERDQNRRGHRSERWWLHGEPVENMRAGRRGWAQTIVTVETTKHRVFQFLPVSTLADNMLVCIASDSGYHLGILSSRVHAAWALASGGRLGVGDDPRYSKTRCFDPFPFPQNVSDQLQAEIAKEAEALDALRKQVMAENADLTLTRIYNTLELLRAAEVGGSALEEGARDVHDRGLVSLLLQHHNAVDRLVAEAYGWNEEWATGTLSDDLILSRIVALNAERSMEEKGGLIRWLRPSYQAPDYTAPTNADLNLGEALQRPIDNVLSWPSTLPEQVGAVQSILAGSRAPLAAQDVARNFRNKRASTVRPVLDALAGLGMARRTDDGRYAA